MNKSNKSFIIIYITLMLCIVILACILIGVLVFSKYIEQEYKLPQPDNVFSVTSDECYYFEQYDASTNECYVECDTDEECAYYDDLYAELFNDAYDFNDDDVNFDESNLDEEASLLEYSITADRSIDLVSGDVDDLSAEYDFSNTDPNLIWNYTNALFPDTTLIDFPVTFLIFTDGIDGTLAYVIQSEDDEDEWIIAIDVADSIKNGEFVNKKDLTYTLVHEYAHLFSLSYRQIDYDVFEDECTTYYIQEGCTFTQSYVKTFYDEFWSGSLDSQHQTVLESCDEEYDCDAQYDFYLEHQDLFLSEYAATNPIEDIAESWSFYVLDIDSQDHPKVDFFNQFPELVTLRNDIRKNLIDLSV